jgi:integrase
MASTRVRNSRFIGLYRDAQGRQKSAGTFDTEHQALKAGKHAEALANPPEIEMAYRTEKRGKVTVAGYGPGWLEGHRLEASSREGYTSRLKHIIRELGTKTLAEIEPADVRAFLRKLERSGLSSGTVRHIRTTLNEMFKCAVIDGLIDRNPCDGTKVKPESNREMLIATPAQAKVIRAAIGPAYKVLVEAMFATGMRYSELMALRPQDIEISGDVAVIKAGRSVMIEVAGKPLHRDYGKTKNSSRDVNVSADLGRRMIDGARHGWIFRAPRGGYLNRSNFRGNWKRACAAASVPALRVHDARHSHASWLANDPQTPLANVRDRLGHSSLAVTSRYIHVMHADIDPCLAALERCMAA